MTKPSTRRTCDICGRLRMRSSFSDWGYEHLICKNCEIDLIDDDDEAAPAAGLIKDHDETISAASEDAPAPQQWGPINEEIDENIVSLVNALNRYPGVVTIGSCGGHEVITNPSQWQAGSWYVKFDLPASRRGWLVMEHLAWAINHDCQRAGRHVVFMPTSVPPFLNTPGKCLHFVIEGYDGEDPNHIAEFLDQVRQYFNTRPL